MGDGIRGIYFMLRVDVVVQTELGVKEVVAVVDDILASSVIAPTVCRVLHAIVDIAILQVNISVQAAQKGVVSLCIDVGISLLGVVTIVFEVGLCIGVVDIAVNGLAILFVLLVKILVIIIEVGLTRLPDDTTKVVAIILVPAATKNGLQVVMVVIDERGNSTIEVVGHLLLTYQIALNDGLKYRS